MDSSSPQGAKSLFEFVSSKHQKIQSLICSAQNKKSIQTGSICLILAICAVIASIGYWQEDLVFRGQPGLKSIVTAECIEEAQPQVNLAEVFALGYERFRVSTQKSSDRELRISLKPESGIPNYLMLRFQPIKDPVQVMLESPAGRLEISSKEIGENPQNGLRLVLNIEAASKSPVSVILKKTGSSSEKLVINEIALYESKAGLLGDERFLYQKMHDLKFYRSKLVQFIFYLGVLATLALTFVPVKYQRILVCLLGFVFCISIGFFCLRLQIYNRDLREWIAAGQLQESASSNLNIYLHMGSCLAQGHGPVFAPKCVPWHRMPGCSFVGAGMCLFAGSTTDFFSIILTAIKLQIIMVGFGALFCAWCATPLLGPRVTFFSLLLVSFLSTLVLQTLIESYIVAFVLYLLGVCCLYLKKLESGESPGWKWTLLLHSGFAAWHFNRPDILPCWAAVSLVLHYKNPRQLLVPVGYFLLMGVPWGLFKYSHTGEFNMTTTSFGASAMCGLWEIPHKFIWEVEDGTYFQWMQSNHVNPSGTAGNSFATREVVRFWFTFPGYMISLVWHEFMTFIYEQSFIGLAFCTWVRGAPLLAVFGVLAFSLISGFKRMQTFLLGAIIFFNMPIFFLIYSSGGRFYNTTGIALVIATMPLIFDTDFYKQLLARRKLAVGILVLVIAIAVGGRKFDVYLQNWDGFRYATPFLNAKDSTIYVLKHPTNP